MRPPANPPRLNDCDDLADPSWLAVLPEINAVHLTGEQLDAAGVALSEDRYGQGDSARPAFAGLDDYLRSQAIGPLAAAREAVILRSFLMHMLLSGLFVTDGRWPAFMAAIAKAPLVMTEIGLQFDADVGVFQDPVPETKAA